MSKSDKMQLRSRKNKKSSTKLYTFLGGTYEEGKTI